MADKAVSNAIYQTTVAKRLASVPGLSAGQQASLLDAALADLSTLAPDTLSAVRQAYADSIKVVFAAFIAFVAVCILLSIQIQVSCLDWSRSSSADVLGNTVPRGSGRAQGGEAPS